MAASLDRTRSIPAWPSRSQLTRGTGRVGRPCKAALAAGIGCSLALAVTSLALGATPGPKRAPAAKNAVPHKDATEQPRSDKPAAHPTMPIDQATMMAPGSSITLNGSTFQVGLQSSPSSLKSPMADLPSGASMSGDAVAVERAGTVLDGYDLRGLSVSVEADNVTIRNCLLNAAGYHTVYQGPTASGLVVEFNTFDGEKANHPTNGDMVLAENEATIRNNEFFNLPADAVNVVGGVVEHNYFSGASYQKDAHADAISVHRTTVPVLIRENYIDYIDRPDAQQGTNAAIKIVSHFGAIDNVTVDSNVLLGGGYTIYVSPAEDPNTRESHPVSNVTLSNNDIGYGQYGAVAGGNHGTKYTFLNNHNFLSDPHLLAAGERPAGSASEQTPAAVQ